MKLQPITIVLVLIALGLGGFVYFHEIQRNTQQEAVKDKQKKIFAFAKEQIQAFTIKDQKQTLQFERLNQDTNNNRLVTWQMKTPSQVTANDASVSYLLDLLVNGKSNDSFVVTNNKLNEYGLDQPQAIVEVKLKNNQTHQLVIGKPNFDRSLLYAQADPGLQNNQQLNVLLVPMDFQYAVNRPLSEWEAKQENLPNTSSKSPGKTVTKGLEQVKPSSTATKSEQAVPKKLNKVNPSPNTEKFNNSIPKKLENR